MISYDETVSRTHISFCGILVPQGQPHQRMRRNALTVYPEAESPVSKV